MENRPGFVFSLDAFVAFSLILISIQSMLVISSVPSGYYPSLLQAEYLAKDTLQTVAVTPVLGSQTLADTASARALDGSGFSPGDPIVQATDSMIPYPYSYAYHFYDSASGRWILLYNASVQNPKTDPHYNVSYWRVEAPAHLLVMGYTDPVSRGDSPYCNVVCHGYDAKTNSYAPPGSCDKVPCNVSTASTFDPGNFTVGILRLTVWG